MKMALLSNVEQGYILGDLRKTLKVFNKAGDGVYDATYNN